VERACLGVGSGCHTILIMKPFAALPAHSPPTSIRDEFKEVFELFQRYRTANLAENVQEKIHSVAMNRTLSQQIVTQIKSGLRITHREYLRICATCAIIFLLPFLASLLVGLALGERYSNLMYGGVCLFWLVAAELFMFQYFAWRREHGDTYIADYLTRALEIGLEYQNNSSNAYLRDTFAESIQGVAIRYFVIFRESASTRFFGAQVRSRAKSCRNDIVSLIPGLVTAGETEIEAINSDLARLVIRSQTGYWYQTSDIARQGMPIPRRDAIWISFASSVRDRSIQVALIALTATLIAAAIAATANLFK
jgi:hypothetical protein